MVVCPLSRTETNINTHATSPQNRDWNPAVNDQAVDRCHRIGQTKPVTVYVLVAADTVDETIYKRAAGKKEKSESLLDKGDEAEAAGGGGIDGSGRRCVCVCVEWLWIGWLTV